MNRLRLMPVSMLLFLSGVSGCGETDTKDPTIDVRQQETYLLALTKSSSTEEFIPMRVVASKSEPDFWLITVIKDGDPKKRGKFKINKKTEKVERLPD